MVKPDRGLFWWSDVERRPELERLEMVLKALPDEELLAALEQRRGRGRDDYPIRAMWRALVAGIVFQHVSIQSLFRELRRNPALLDVCGFDPLGPRRRPKREVVVGAEGPERVLKEVPRGDGVGSAWNFSRFLSSVAKLEAERGLIQGMAVRLREQLMEEVEGFGEHLGYDGKAVESHSTGRKRGKRGQTSDPDADWGTLKYRCPAAAYGFDCAGRESCYRAAGSQAGAFGRIVRIPLATRDRRMFTPTPYGSPSWKRGYRRRSALERIYSRLDNDFGFERHFLRGRSRMTARVGLGLTVMMALALAQARAGRQDRTRSLVGAVPFADTG